MLSGVECFAFISYSRKDALVATSIQTFLESYQIPKKLVRPDVLPKGKYIRKVFVDTLDLGTATPDFREELERHIAESEYLLVICSRNSADERSYVHREIRHFLSTHNNDYSKIMPIALDGVSCETIPAELTEIVANRNIVVMNRTWIGTGASRALLQNAHFHIIEFLLKVDANVLNNRYWIRFQRRLKFVISIGFTVFMSLMFMMAYSLKQQQRRTEFEKKVFPLSIDHSYAQAFAIPLFSIRTNCQCFLIAAMPKNYAELANKPGPKLQAVTADLRELGWDCVKREYPVQNRRPLVTYELLKNGHRLPGKEIYVDVVSQLSAVKKVLDYLTSNEQYHPVSEREELSSFYVREFEKILPDLLQKEIGPRGTNVHYVTERQDLEKALQQIDESSNY